MRAVCCDYCEEALLHQQSTRVTQYTHKEMESIVNARGNIINGQEGGRPREDIWLQLLVQIRATIKEAEGCLKEEKKKRKKIESRGRGDKPTGDN